MHSNAILPWHIFFDLFCVFANLLYPFLSASLRFHLYSLQCPCGIHFSTISTLFISFLLPFLIISLISHNFSIYSIIFLSISLLFSWFLSLSSLLDSLSTSQAVSLPLRQWPKCSVPMSSISPSQSEPPICAHRFSWQIRLGKRKLHIFNWFQLSN